MRFPHISEIENYFKEHGIKSKTFQLTYLASDGTRKPDPARIPNVKKFVEGHLRLLKSNPSNGDKRKQLTFFPYYERLNQIYQYEFHSNKKSISPKES